MTTSPQQLLRALMRGAPFQPATNLWRAVELDALLRHGLPAGRVLDLGCGDGKLTKVLAEGLAARAGAGEAANTWIGIDMDPAETAQARGSGVYRLVYTGSAAAIPEADGSFDLVFSNSVLEHIGPIDDVLAEASRVLRIGGRFICTVPGPGFHACLRGPSFGRLTRAAYEREIDARCAHLRYWDAETWASHLQARQLQIRHCSSYLTQQQVQAWERVSAVTGGLAYRFAGRRAQPIDIQRRLHLRSTLPGIAGSLGAGLSPLLAAICPLGSDAPGPRHGCLLLDAEKTANP